MTALIEDAESIVTSAAEPVSFFLSHDVSPLGKQYPLFAQRSTRARTESHGGRTSKRSGFGSQAARWRSIVAPATLAIGDAIAFMTAWLALAFFSAEPPLPLSVAAAIAAAATTAFYLDGLYPGYQLHDHERLRRRVRTALLIGAAGFVVAGLLSDDWSKGGFVAALLGVSLGLQLLLHACLRAALWRAGLWGEDASVFGEPQEVAQLSAFFRRHWRFGIRPTDRGSAAIAVVAAPSTPDSIGRLSAEYSKVFLVGNVPGVCLPMTLIPWRRGEIGLTVAGGKQERAFSLLDRFLDLAVAIPAAVLLVPVMGLGYLAVRLSDPGPALYRQMREGLDGRPFPVLKLRTMYLDADARLERLLQTDPQARAEWEAHFKLRNDPRVLPTVGTILRARSIDELPQLFNVIAGQMRIVGPRPFPDYHLAAMDACFRARRRKMKPGLTGLWQISERSAADIALQQQMDEFYMENRSFWFDLHIILNTASAVLRGRGAY